MTTHISANTVTRSASHPSMESVSAAHEGRQCREKVADWIDDLF
jgi:hypothetical protein